MSEKAREGPRVEGNQWDYMGTKDYMGKGYQSKIKAVQTGKLRRHLYKKHHTYSLQGKVLWVSRCFEKSNNM